MTPSRFAVWRWGAFSLVPCYAMITLGVATAATAPTPRLLPPQFEGLATRAAEALPGTSLWPDVMDLHSKISGGFPAYMVAFIALALVFLGAIARARRTSARISRDEATAHDERIRELERQKMRGQ